MRATDVLRNEHEVIQQVLDCLEVLAERAVARDNVDVPSAERALDFLAAFADRCHHAKEERHLFRALNAAGLPTDAGPLAVMLHEHDAGRAAIAAMRGAVADAKHGVEGAPQRFAVAARGYVGLLRDHIAKENGVLFPLAERMLDGPRQAALARDFERVEQDDMEPGTHERYLELAQALCARLGVEWAAHAAVAHACCGHSLGQQG